MKRAKFINKSFTTSFTTLRLVLPLFLIFFILNSCSTSEYIQRNENEYKKTSYNATHKKNTEKTIPSEMTPEQKKPTNPLHNSPYLIKKLENIPKTSSREEVLEGREEYYLGYHDILRITVFGREDPVKGVTDIVRDTEIRDDGKISYPLIGDVWAAGLTIPELQYNIIGKLKEYISAPKIDIQIINYRSRDVSILGEVRKPQVIYLRGKTTLLEAIAKTGGLTERANLKGAYIIRKDKIVPLDLYALMTEGDLKYNLELKRKDVVYIPNVQDQRVYVVGEVNSPRIVPFAGKVLTVAEAIANAGDFKISAKRSHLKIIRGGLEHPTIITVDFNKITRGNLTENIALHSEDIVFAPASIVGEWNKILEQITPSLQTILFGITLDNLINK